MSTQPQRAHGRRRIASAILALGLLVSTAGSAGARQQEQFDALVWRTTTPTWTLGPDLTPRLEWPCANAGATVWTLLADLTPAPMCS